VEEMSQGAGPDNSPTDFKDVGLTVTSGVEEGFILYIVLAKNISFDQFAEKL
jgi:hypothetical protein